MPSAFRDMQALLLTMRQGYLIHFEDTHMILCHLFDLFQKHFRWLISSMIIFTNIHLVI
jgi:hypothetical protein